MTDNYRIDRLEHAIHQLIDILTVHQPEWAGLLRQGSLLDIHTIVEQRTNNQEDGTTQP